MTPAVFSHGSLRLYLLSLLDESPRHGYELIQALSERFGGTYSPSAGTIYPRLAKLEEDGLVSKTADGRKTIYTITAAGRAELTERRGELEDIESEVTDSVRRLADEVRAGVETAMRSLRADLASAARERGRSGSAPTVVPVPVPDERAASRLALREADLILGEFRQQVRADLRSHAAREAVSAETVAGLRRSLARLRVDLLAELNRR